MIFPFIIQGKAYKIKNNDGQVNDGQVNYDFFILESKFNNVIYNIYK